MPAGAVPSKIVKVVTPLFTLLWTVMPACAAVKHNKKSTVFCISRGYLLWSLMVCVDQEKEVATLRKVVGNLANMTRNQPVMM